MDIENKYIVEFIGVRNVVKVTAIDPVTKIEVSMVFPAKGMTQRVMGRMASKKLEYVLKKRENNNSTY